MPATNGLVYVRVVFAVREDDVHKKFLENLDEFIEETDLVQGAYVSGPYHTRASALDGLWNTYTPE